MRGRKGHILIAITACAVGLAPAWLFLLTPGAETAPPAEKLPATSSSVSVTVKVIDESKGGNLPDRFSLSQNYPNPFNPETVIRYSLPEDCPVELVIYNLLGQKVKVLVDEYQSAGYKAVHWNGRDERGKQTASGLYFYTIDTPKFTQTKKMVLLR